jgi:hypothetical protein
MVDRLSLAGLGIVVAFGIGFLLWTLAHLFIESQPRREAARRGAPRSHGTPVINSRATPVPARSPQKAP